jgi:KaiC/GvpD/RAD55 family RecA-like ATPase
MAEKTEKTNTVPMRVSTFDQMIDAGGLERGSTVLLSGGCGSGKTVFAMQSAYMGALAGEKTVYITLEESPEKLKSHMKAGFGWDIDSMEGKGLMSVLKVDPIELALGVEEMLSSGSAKPVGYYATKKKFLKGKTQQPKKLTIGKNTIDFPFEPDRIVIDSLSALSNMFSNQDYYRLFVKSMVDALDEHNSVNMLLSETEQEPMLYSRIGVEEFIVDGVIVLYNIRKGQLRRRAVEIVKLRSSDHLKEMVPYMISNEGIKILQGENIY